MSPERGDVIPLRMDDNYLLRFLRARSFKVESAYRLVRELWFAAINKCEGSAALTASYSKRKFCGRNWSWSPSRSSRLGTVPSSLEGDHHDSENDDVITDTGSREDRSAPPKIQEKRQLVRNCS
ncbi:hypothetical protein J6590_059081 [Homalodisca vitripennis]|nr:hypothetical protein J6590_059081 [Homalodisca vitripennis]